MEKKTLEQSIPKFTLAKLVGWSKLYGKSPCLDMGHVLDTQYNANFHFLLVKSFAVLEWCLLFVVSIVGETLFLCYYCTALLHIFPKKFLEMFHSFFCPFFCLLKTFSFWHDPSPHFIRNLKCLTHSQSLLLLFFFPDQKTSPECPFLAHFENETTDAVYNSVVLIRFFWGGLTHLVQ